LLSADVIHSFWVPNLHGKTDMIPGNPAHTYIQADRPGVFGGQCAEFCGHQHANMRFEVVAESEDDFQAWLAAQRAPAPDPATESQKRGKQVFMTNSCVLCHTISGTSAQSRVGPDLSHVAGRRKIAAGTLDNARGNLAGWVTDPHGVKPGVRMPPNPVAPADLHALLDYLESLK
jgi:cytochrome c oxidase subunit 2